MKIVKTVSELKTLLASYKATGSQIGLVPTMGALHAGHASLVKRSVSENDVTVVSVFVNPTQFNDKKDLENYPHTLDADCELLDHLGATLVFAPSVQEVYPEPDQRTFSFPPIDEVMEGKFRPGHFNGVCQIVSKLFMFVEPDVAYFGEKDFQQIAVIKAMAKSLGFKVKIIPCPIIRECDGLALSSRNTLLTKEERDIAVNISKYLFESVEFSKSHTLEETRQFVINHIDAVNGLQVQYFEIVDGDSLVSLTNWDESDFIVGCITVFCGGTPIRLIDNIQYKRP